MTSHILVEFKHPWFAPTETVIKEKIVSISGRRFKKGEQEVPKELIGFLPTSAKVVEEKTHDPAPPVVENLQDFDYERQDAARQEEMLQSALAEAQTNSVVKRKPGRPRKVK